MRRVAIVVFDDANLLDVAGPAQVFQTASEQLRLSGGEPGDAYTVELVSAAGGLVRTSPGIGITSKSFAEVASNTFDTVLVSGGHGAEAAGRDPALVAWLQSAAEAARRVGSICTGAFVLAAAGLLTERRAATHWAYCSRLQERVPDTQVQDDSIFVRDGKCWTSAGVTAGIDMTLALVEEDFGRELALLVARRLVVFLKRPGGQSQFSQPLASQIADGPLARLLHWIVENPDADLRTEKLAELANMSLRTLHRAFAETTGTTPADWVEQTRLQIARRLLEQTDEQVQRVAVRSGFVTYERMRRTFLRRIGVTPAAYRARFQPEAAPMDAAREAGVLSTLADQLGEGR